MDQMMLSKLEAHWKPLTDPTDIRAPEEMTPMLIFCAAIQAMVKADRHLAAQELAWIQERMIDTNALRRGGAWLRDHGVDKLLALAKEELTKPQRRCLYSNLIALAMADGAYRSKEAELIDTFRQGLEITDKHHDTVFDVLMARNNLSVFKTEGEEGYKSPEAINLFTACLLGMAQHDGEVHAKEEGMVKQMITEKETINSARTYLEQLGVNGIVDYLPGPLTREQKRCTVLNLMVIATADGVFKSTKQALLDRIRRAMLIEDDEFNADFNTYLTLSNLSVFATEEAQNQKLAEQEPAN